MPLASDIRRRLAYHAWATGQLTGALPADGAPAACAAMAHACTADSVWLRRISGESTAGTDLWPSLSPAEVGALARENNAGYDALLSALADDDLGRTITYRTMAGDPFSTSLGDILEHVLLHGAYHRGQAAIALRADGVPPPSTDFVVWVREEQVASGE